MSRSPLLVLTAVSLTILIQSSKANAQQPAEFVLKSLDLFADQGYDFNGIALNPRWGYQTSSNLVSDARQVCNPVTAQPVFVAPVVINPDCTSQSPTYDAPGIFGPGGFPPGFGGLWSAAACQQDASPLPGHSNWFPATYTGIITWGNTKEKRRPTFSSRTQSASSSWSTCQHPQRRGQPLAPSLTTHTRNGTSCS